MAIILVADDDSNSRLLVATLLEHAGHVVLEASDGMGAMKVADEKNVDLVLVDLSMPGMSGVNFIHALRSEPQHSGTAIVLYTGTPLNEALRDFMNAYDVRGVIPKPSEPLAFIRAVESVLER